MPYYMTTQVDAIVSGLITFCGSNLINENDIQGLIGNHQIAQDNWLSNFVIDNYLELVKLQCADKGIKVQTIKFEIFEKGSIPFIVKKIDSCKLLEQDLILVPCNPTGSDHWFLLAVLPKKKCVLALDSLVAENILKPSVESRMEKMATVLAVYDPFQTTGSFFTTLKVISHNKITIMTVESTLACLRSAWLVLGQW